MKKQLLFIRITILIWMLQSDFVASAQLCNSATPINFGETTDIITTSGASLNSSYSCRAGTWVAAEKVFSFNMPESGTVTITCEGLGGPDLDVFLLNKLCETTNCLAFAGTIISNFPLSAGNHFIVLDGETVGNSKFRLSLTGKNSAGYCFPDYENTCSTGAIQSVTISSPGSVSTQNLNSGCAVNAAGFSTIQANASSIFRDGSVVTITVAQNGGSSAAWIDFNNNGSFQDAGDYLGRVLGVGTHIYTFTVPSSGFGPRRLRIRNASLNQDNAPQDFSSGMPCVLMQGVGGETEDYILNLEPKGCTPSYTASCSGGYINSFILKTISNTNSGCNGNTFNYINYPSTQFTTNINTEVKHTATVGFGGLIASAAIFIDYNADGDFLDNGEMVNKSTVTSGGISSFQMSFTVPAGTIPGIKRLRVRALNAPRTWTQADACALLTGAGETEDYVVNVANSTITITSANINACRGSNHTLTWTTSGDFNSGHRLFAQFSNHLGSFQNGGIAEINLATTGSQIIQIPANLTPGGAHLLRISATSPAVISNIRTVSIPTSGCTSTALTALRIGPSNNATVCKGTSVSIPFSALNFAGGTTFKAQISAINGSNPFTDIPGAVGTTSPINATIPFSLPQGDGYKVRVVSSTNVTSNTSPTLLKLTTCLAVSPAPTSICRGLPVPLPIVASGILAGTSIVAQLSSSTGSFTSPVTIGSLTSGASNPTSISVTIPCDVVSGTAYKIRLVPNGSSAEAGASTTNVTINTNCTPFLSTAHPATLFGLDAFCVGKTYRLSADVFALGCFNAGNQFFVDFLNGSATGPLVASVPVVGAGEYTIPNTMPLGSNYFIRLRSTSPVATGLAVGEYPVEDCPEITLTSVCRVGNEYAVFFTSKGTFASGNQFSVQFSAGGTSVTLGNPGTSSPLMVPIEGSGFPSGSRSITVFSTIEGVSSNSLSGLFFPECERPTITITGLSIVPGSAGSSTSATVCPGGKLRIDFTTTGIFGTGNVFNAWLSGDLEATFDFPERTPTSPLIVEFPTLFNTAPGTVWSVNMDNTIPSSIRTNSGILTVGTGCPTMTINSVSQSEFCNAPTISVGFVKTGTFNAGNTFSVQLSDANGSFANPIDLVGSKATSPISVSLPPQFIPNGTGYRLRLKSSDPALVGNSTTANRSKTGPVLTGSTLGFNPVGTVKTLTGTNLTGVNGVVLNNTSATFSVLNSTTINATIPNTTTGNWVVRKNGCVSNPILQLVGVDQGASASNPGTHSGKTIPAANGRAAVSESGDEVVSIPLQVFPNPSAGKILLHHAAVEKARITIVNMMGQVILEDEMLKDEPEKNLDLIRFPAGIYLVKYQTGTTSSEVRLLKN